MSDHFSGQFPPQPDLRPLPSPPAKGQQIFSSILIATGLLLLGAGGWMFYQYQLEASKPPPARIIEVSLADLTQTPAPPPSPTQAMAPPLGQRAGDTIRLKPTRPVAVGLVSAAEATPASKPARPAPEATATPETATAASETTLPVAPTPAATPIAEATAEAAPSLEDNPLIAPENTATGALELPAPAPTPVEASPITRIVAESIGLDAPVIAVGWETIIRADGTPVNVWTVADYAAGWHKNSALPGQGGNIVLSGHHNIKGEVFRYTIELNVGDIVTLYEGDQAFKYVVVDKFIVKDKGEPEAVRRENAKWIGPFNEERLTLVTCWPYTNNTHRAIVIAKPAPQ